jgi:hypothetical protein
MSPIVGADLVSALFTPTSATLPIATEASNRQARFPCLYDDLTPHSSLLFSPDVARFALLDASR